MTTHAMHSSAPAKPSRIWSVSLWIIQALLALVFGMAGFMKLTAPIDALAAQLIWPGDVPIGLVRFIGAAELLGAIGLIVPSVTRIKPGLTPVAALGLAAVMLMAAVFHISRGELLALPSNLILAGLAILVAWGRFRKAPIFFRKSMAAR